MNDIKNLQEQIAFQERTIDTLNDALTSQQQQISRLQDEVKILAQLLREWRLKNPQNTGEQDGAQTAYEIPPHY